MIDVTGKNFKEEVLEAEGTVMVDFKAPWCGYCRRLEPTVEKIGEEFQPGVKLVGVDIDADPELAEQFNVMTIPTLFLFRDGAAVSSVVNPANRDAIVGWLQENKAI